MNERVTEMLPPFLVGFTVYYVYQSTALTPLNAQMTGAKSVILPTIAGVLTVVAYKLVV